MTKKHTKTILVTGVFDLLHKEHVRFLEKARELGEKLIVGVESDERVRQIKGASRPNQPEGERVKSILDLEIADRVIVLPEEFGEPKQHIELLKQIKPDILAVSSHTPHLEEKERLMKKVGGEVIVVLEHNPEVSTTKILGD